MKEKKDPYLFVRATKLDSATGLPDLKCSISDICCDSAGIAPNEETKVIDGAEDDFEIEKDTFIDWLDFNDSSAEKPVVTDIKQEWNQVWRVSHHYMSHRVSQYYRNWQKRKISRQHSADKSLVTN